MHMKSRFQLFVAIIAVALLAFQPFAAKAAAPSLPALEVTAGTYHSDEISGGEAEGETLELTLYDDGTALLIHFDVDGNEALVEYGDWEESDSQLVLTITGDDSTDYDEPIEIIFDVESDTLSAAEYDEEAFGSDGFTFTLDTTVEGDSTASDAIVFVSDGAVDADGNEIKVSLAATGVEDAEEGTIELTTENADGETVVEVGSWTQADSTSDEVAITITGTADEEYDEAVTMTLLVDNQAEVIRLTDASDGRYGEDGIELTISLDFAGDSEATSSDDDTSTPPGIYYSPSLMVNDADAFYAPLIQLSEDGTAQWNTNYFDGTPAMSEVGTWALAEDGTLTVTITGVLDSEGTVTEHAEPIEVSFNFSYDSLTNYDAGLYMYKLSLPYDYEASSEETSSEEASSEEPATEETAALVYESAELADGSTIHIEFAEDGTAVVTSIYSDGSDDLVEVAEWTLDEATDVLTLTISGTEDEEYAEPIEWVFDAGGDTLTATEWDTDLYGEDAPVMEMVEE